MKKNWLLTAVVILMSATAFSQKPIIRKATIDGQNGFIANEVVMDSIMEMHYAFTKSLITNETLTINLQFLQKKLDKVNLQVDFLTKDNSRLELQKKTLTQQLANKDEQHAIDLIYYKVKSKNWLSNFLLGTGTGALIVALIVIIGK